MSKRKNVAAKLPKTQAPDPEPPPVKCRVSARVTCYAVVAGDGCLGSAHVELTYAMAGGQPQTVILPVQSDDRWAKLAQGGRYVTIAVEEW